MKSSIIWERSFAHWHLSWSLASSCWPYLVARRADRLARQPLPEHGWGRGNFLHLHSHFQLCGPTHSMMPDGVEVDLDELLEKANHMKRAMGEARKVPQVNPDCSVKKVNMEGVRNVSMRFSRYYRVCLFLIRHCKRVTNSQYSTRVPIWYTLWGWGRH